MQGAGAPDPAKGWAPKHWGENYYAAFVIDPDGNRLEAYCGAAEKAR